MELKTLNNRRMNLPLALNDVLLSSPECMMTMMAPPPLTGAAAGGKASPRQVASPTSFNDRHSEVLSAAIKMAAGVGSNMEYRFQQQQQQRPQFQLKMEKNDVNQDLPTPTMISSPRLQQSQALRVPFLLQVKVLLQYLRRQGRNSNNPSMFLLYTQAKEVVSTCVKRNRMGDANFTPLKPTLSALLRELVGDVHWEYSKVLTQHMIKKKKIINKQQHQTTKNAASPSSASTSAPVVSASAAAPASSSIDLLLQECQLRQQQQRQKLQLQQQLQQQEKMLMMSLAFQKQQELEKQLYFQQQQQRRFS